MPLVFGLNVHHAFTQVSSHDEYFYLSFTEACEGAVVTISFNESKINLGTDQTYFWCFDTDISAGQNNPDAISIDNQDCFSANTSNNPTLNFTYTQAGTYWVYWYLQKNQGRDYDSLKVTIHEAVRPEVSIYQCQSGELVLDVLSAADPYSRYEVNWGDGSNQLLSANQLPIKHLYEENNQSYTLNVQGLFGADSGNSPDCGSQSVFTRNVVPDDLMVEAARFVSLQSLNQSDLQFSFELTPNIKYELEERIGTGNFISIQSLYNQNEWQLDGRNLTDHLYSYRITLAGDCDNSSLNSSVISPVYITSVEALEEGNNLQWKTQAGLYNVFDVQQSGQVTGQTGTMQYLDESVICGISYQYRILATSSEGAQIISNEVNTTAVKSTNQVIINHLSTEVLEDGSLELSWENPASYQPDIYYIYYSFDNNNFFLEDSTASLTYKVDFDTNNEERFFRVSYVDNCEGESPLSLTASNILLKSNESQGELLVSWNAYRGWESGVESYFLEKFDAEMNLIASFSGLDATDFTDEVLSSRFQTVIYRVTAIGQEGRRSVSNDLIVQFAAQIHFPTAFTPDGDGRNEYFRVYGKFISEYQLYIYNRWGNLVFYTDVVTEGWDGDFNNQPASEGSYVYKAVVVDDNGNRHSREGSFILMRNR